VPRNAFLGACRAWLGEFGSGECDEASLLEFSLSPRVGFLESEVIMLGDVFYLPYEQGPWAQHMVLEFRWIAENGRMYSPCAVPAMIFTGRR
jgi:hypothetical protein